MNRQTILYATLAVIVIGIVVAVGLASRVPKAASDTFQQSNLKVGDSAPEFTVATNAGTFDLAQVSTPVLLEVFATWCPHCQREVTVLNDVAAKYAGKVAIVAVNGSDRAIDGNAAESQADVNTFGQQFGVRYPIGFDPDLKVAHQYIQAGFPTLVLIDKNKKVVWVKDGEIPEKDILAAVKAALTPAT